MTLDAGIRKYKSSATLIVAASNSLHKERADYVCPGVDDQVVIQAANAEVEAAGGGRVVLLEGTFNCAGTVTLGNNCTLEGQGDTTILTFTSGKLVLDYDKHDIIVRNLKITGDTGYIMIKGVRIKVFNVTVEDSSAVRVFMIYSDTLNQPRDILFENCTAKNCSGYGFDISDWGEAGGLVKRVRFINCKAINCGDATVGWAPGFCIHDGVQIEDVLLLGCRAEGSWESGFHMENSPLAKRVLLVGCESINNGQKPSPAFAAGYLVSGDTKLIGCISESNLKGPGFMSYVGNGVRFSSCFDDGSLKNFALGSGAAATDIILDNCEGKNAITTGLYCVNINNISARNLKIDSPGGDSVAGWNNSIYNVDDSDFDLCLSGGDEYIDINIKDVQNLVLCGKIKTGHIYPIYVQSGSNILIKNMDFFLYGSEQGILVPNSASNAHTIRIKDVNIYKMSSGVLYGIKNVAAEKPQLSGVSVIGAETAPYLNCNVVDEITVPDLFRDVLAVSATHVRSNEDLSVATPITFTIDAQPDVPRTLSAHFDSHAQITEYDIEIIGVDAKGNTITETKDETDGWDWETSNAFAIITSIKMTARTGTGVGDTMDIGITDVLGLSNNIYATSDVFKIQKNNANATVAAAQVNTTYDTYDMAVIGLAGGDDFTIWFKSNLNIMS